MAARVELADVAGDDANQHRAPTILRHMEVVTDAFAVMVAAGLMVPKSRAHRTIKSFGDRLI